MFVLQLLKSYKTCWTSWSVSSQYGVFIVLVCIMKYLWLQGSVSCTKKSGCWRVRGSRGITAGCVDLITTLLPSECGLACKLEYQGYGTCEVTRGVVVCYSCHPGAALCPEANSILMMSSISVLYFMIRHLRSQHWHCCLILSHKMRRPPYLALTETMSLCFLNRCPLFHISVTM